MHYKNKEIANMYSVSWVANVTDHMTVEENEVHHILLYLIIYDAWLTFSFFSFFFSMSVG